MKDHGWTSWADDKTEHVMNDHGWNCRADDKTEHVMNDHGWNCQADDKQNMLWMIMAGLLELTIKQNIL